MTGTTATPPPPRRGTGRRPTMADVARAAGVNPSTVSRALDDRHPFSRGDTAARIRQIAEQLGYTPNPAAASLRRQSTRTIGVVMSSITGTVMAMLYEEIAEACRDHGLDALLATTHDDLEAETAIGRLLLSRRVDGLIMATARLEGPGGFLPELAADGTPFVLALRTDGHSPAVLGDDRLGGYLAARHLLDLGHRRIGMIAGPTYASNALGRVAGLREALAEAGVEMDDRLVRPSDFSMESGESTAAELLALPDGQRPTALVTVSDNTAVGALAAARRRGLAVPDDLSVVGYNDTPLAARLPIPLTSVRVPLREIGRGAVDMLLRIRQGRPVRSTAHAPTLIPRESTATARGIL